MLKNKTHGIDKKILFILGILLVFGLTMIASGGIVYSQVHFGDSYYFFKHQIFYGILPGIVLLCIAQEIKYTFWKKIATPLFLLSIILLILVLIPGLGTKIYGAKRWIKLGLFSFQPAEMLKLAIVIYLAAWLENKVEIVKDFFEGPLPFLVVVSLISFLLVKQPDIGTLGVIILVSFSIFFISGAKISHLVLVGMAGTLAMGALIKMETYRMNRFLVFLHPELDPRGIGYQINQALMAIGSGGILGVGLGRGVQKINYLPEPVGDSIFAVIGEELGLVGCLFLISLFIFLAIRGFRIAKKAPDQFSKLMAVGIVSWVIFQAFINMAAISGLIPLTGIPLPFISYGGTSIIFLMIAMGILLNISRYT